MKERRDLPPFPAALFTGLSRCHRRGGPMEYELVAIVLAAVLPVYPALFVIYQKIGKYDVVCEEFRKLREEHDRILKGKDVHGT